MPDPLHGLRTLSNLLTADGGINLMVYPRVARTGAAIYSKPETPIYWLAGIYQFQQLVRLINEGVTERSEELDNLWDLLKDFVAAPNLGLPSLQVPT